jgi:hypothetical protein
MKRKWMLAMAVVLAATLAGVPSAHGRASIYVASGPGYSAAFKVRAGRAYVLALDARAYCRGTGSHSGEHNRGWFNVFSTPTRMRPSREGLRGVENVEAPLWSERAVVRAHLRRGAVVGTFAVTYDSEETECRSGSYAKSPKVPFKAVRYLPAGAPGAGRRSDRGVGQVYFTNAGSVEVFLRRVKGRVVGIRGAVKQWCPVPGSESPRVPLFGLPEAAPLGGNGDFKRREHFHGASRNGRRYDERMWLTGRVQPGAVVSSYHRVKTRKRGDRIVRRCEAGPVSYRAIRYVRAR